MEVEFRGGIGYATADEADDLEEFAFDRGDRFVMWHARRGERADGDEWAVVERSFQYTVSWVRERDDVPTRESHRVYKLLSRNTFNEVYLSERDLKRSGQWKHAEEIEDDQEAGGDR
jgi:hypothetical protein